MRNGQQKRMRGRQNNNRRGSNPLTRVYESNGPDMKVRGTAHHIAEKYQQLARDAQSSGDYVAAENYYQHAEHYLRLIASLQAQFAPQQGFGREGDEMEEGDDEDVSGLEAPQPYQRDQFQPRDNYQPREQRQGRDDRGPRDDRQPRDDRGPRDNRQNGYQRRNREEEGGEGYQPREFRNNRRDEDQGGYAPRPPRPPREERAPREERFARAERSEDEQPIGLPSFITGGAVRSDPRPAAEEVEQPAPAAEAVPEIAAEAAPQSEDAGEEGRTTATRRRRSRYRARAEQTEGGEERSAEPEQQPSFGE